MNPRTVWKYEMPDTMNDLRLPRDSKVLHVASQAGVICLWAEVDPSEPLRSRRFYVVGTGHTIPTNHMPPVHLGSFLTDPQGTYVFHVYESMDVRMTSAMEEATP